MADLDNSHFRDADNSCNDLQYFPPGCSLKKGLDGLVITMAPRHKLTIVLLVAATLLGGFILYYNLYEPLQTGKITWRLVVKGGVIGTFFLIFLYFSLQAILGTVRIDLDGYTLKYYSGICGLGCTRKVDWANVKDIIIEQVRYQRNSEPFDLLILVGDFNNDNKRINLHSSGTTEEVLFLRDVLIRELTRDK